MTAVGLSEGDEDWQAEARALVEACVAEMLAACPRRMDFGEAAYRLARPLDAVIAAFTALGLEPRPYLQDRRMEALEADLRAGRFASAEAAMRHWAFPPKSPDFRARFRRRFHRTPQEAWAEGWAAQ